MAEMGLLPRSFYGGVLILVVIIVRAVLLDKLPKRTFLILWGVALLRLLIPVSFSSSFSIYSLLGQKEAGQKLQAWQEQMAQDYTDHNIGEGLAAGDLPIQLTEKPAAPVEKMPAFRNLFSMSRAIWCAGVCICALFFITVYLRCLREFRTALPVEDNDIQRWMEKRKLWRRISVRQSDRISAPLTYGIFRPVILLPKKLVSDNFRELEYVMQHEYMHIRHCDAALKLVLAAVLCIHWFNPIVWVMYGLMNRDIELACDESVLHRLGENSRSRYALALIGMEERHSGAAALYSGFSRNPIEKRIKSIMRYRSGTMATIGVGMFLVIIIVFTFATSAQKAEAAVEADIAGNGIEAVDANGFMESHGGDSGISAGIFGADSPLGNRGNSGVDSPAGNRGNSGVDSPAGNRGNSGADSLAGNAGIHGAGQPDGYALTFTLEGMQESVPADLYIGDGYGILIPSEGWNMYQPGEWAADANEEVQLLILDYGEKTKEQVAEYFVSIGYSVAEENPSKLRRSRSSDLSATIELFERQIDFEKVKTRGIMCRYPSEAAEGFGARLAAMAASFFIIPDTVMAGGTLAEPELWESRLETVNQQAYGMPNMRKFWEAYLSGDSEALKEYLTEDFEGKPDVFPDGTDGHDAEKAELRAVKWEDIEGRAIGDTSVCSLEIWPGEGDSLEYLTIGLIMEEDWWKVSWYGLER